MVRARAESAPRAAAQPLADLLLAARLVRVLGARPMAVAVAVRPAVLLDAHKVMIVLRVPPVTVPMGIVRTVEIARSAPSVTVPNLAVEVTVRAAPTVIVRRVIVPRMVTVPREIARSVPTATDPRMGIVRRVRRVIVPRTEIARRGIVRSVPTVIVHRAAVLHTVRARRVIVRSVPMVIVRSVRAHLVSATTDPCGRLARRFRRASRATNLIRTSAAICGPFRTTPWRWCRGTS